MKYMQNKVDNNTEDIEKAIKYKFKNKKLLLQSLTHRSYSNENKESPNNERLEFLGDAILQFIATEYLYKEYPDADEGILSKYRSLLVKTDFLYKIAKKINIQKYLRVSLGQKKDLNERGESILADSIESIIGAIFLDGGFENARVFIYANILKDSKK